MSKQLFAQKLAESGIPQGAAREARIVYMPPAKVRGKTGHAVPGAFIPYWTEGGKVNGHWRIRYLEVPVGCGKYVQPARTPPKLYLPPSVDWQAVAADAEVPVYVTEGEFKALKAAIGGLACAGLGGVSSWKSKRLARPLIDELAGFAWEGRVAYLVPDSDFHTNTDVQAAFLSLGRELVSRGAMAHVVPVPAGPGGEGRGLDDYLVAEGFAALSALVAEAEPLSLSQELWQLSQEVAYVRDPGIVVELSTGRKMTPVAFRDHAYANRHYWTEKADGGMRKAPAARAWLEWPHRRDLSGFSFEPALDPGPTAAGAYNLWPGWGCESRRGDVSPWRELLAFLFKGEPASRRWFEQWCAHQVQHPGVKLYTCCVIWGVRHGTGKSLLGYSMMSVFGRAAQELHEGDLHATHNEWAEGTVFVLGEEIAGRDRRANADRVKTMITQRTHRINVKYMPTYTVPDRINYLFTSNHPDAFVLEDTDRRAFVHEVTSPDPLERAFYERYDKWLNRSDGEGSSALRWHLERVDLSGFNPRGEAPLTSSKEDMILQGKSDLQLWCRRAVESPEAVLAKDGRPLEGDLFTNAQLLSLYDPERRTWVTQNALGRELRRAGVRQITSVRTAQGRQRLYAIRNRERWSAATRAEAGRHWDSHFGPKSTKGAKRKKKG